MIWAVFIRISGVMRNVVTGESRTPVDGGTGDGFGTSVFGNSAFGS